MAKRRRLPAQGTLPVAMLALLMAPQARADWKFTPEVGLREIYTDNVKLEVDQLARSQFITDLVPSLTIASENPRLKVHATLAAHLYRFSNERVEGTNRSQRQLAANAKGRLIDDLLYFDATASIAQRAVSAFGPQVADNGYADTNRTEVSTWRISPYLAHRFGPSATAELRYIRDAVKSGNVGLGDSTADTLSMSIASGPAFRTVGWGVQASHQELDSTRGGKSSQDTASVTLRWRISEALNATANGGYDKYDYQALGGRTAGSSYSAGFIWSPSLRTKVQATAGHRYFGSSYALSALHRSRRSVWNINYNDAVTTTRAQFLLPATVDTAALLDRLFSATIADPVARQQAVDAYLRATGLPASLADNINYLSNRFILQRQLQAAVAFNSAKTTTVLSLNATRRNALSVQQTDSVLLGPSLANLNDNTRQAGGSVAFNYRISPRSDLNLTASKVRTESLSTGIKDNKRLLSLAMTRLLQPKLKGAVELHRAQGNALTLGGRTYRENAISASLSLQL